MGKFKGGLKGKGMVNSVIMAVITETNYRCNWMQVIIIIKVCKKNLYA